MIEALKPNKHVLKVAFVNTLGVSRAMLLGRFAKGFWEESLIWNKDEAGERPNIYSDRAKASVMGVASLVVGLMELLPYMTTFVGIATLNY